MFETSTGRGGMEIAGVLVAVGVVLVLGVVLLGGGSGGDSLSSGVTDETESTSGTFSTGYAGAMVDTADVDVREVLVERPDAFDVGSRLAVRPGPLADEVAVTWLSEADSPVPANSETVSANSLVQIPVNEFGNTSNTQYTALESLNLTDPFRLVVTAPTLAGQNSTDYAVTAFYDGFNTSPSDRLSGPRVPLVFDANGTAAVTIGSNGTRADVTTELAFGSLSGNATLVNNIEVPVGTDSVAVETAD
ncbi:MAG: hypothetical protein ACI9K3_001001 [Halovenus sp.]|jgi:hypothetical protein